MKTSLNTTTWNWNAHVLLHNQPQQRKRVGTSTSCSAVCGVRRTIRAQWVRYETLGTSITWSASTICGTQKSDVSNLLHGAPHLRPLLIKSQRLGGKASTSPSSSILKYSVPLGEESSGPWRCTSRSPPPPPWQSSSGSSERCMSGPNITTVMKGCCQGHSQRKLFVPPVHAQPTVTSSLRCTVAFSH